MLSLRELCHIIAYFYRTIQPIAMAFKVLITGGTGLIGRALTRTLCQKGYSVNILTRQLQAEGKQSAEGGTYFRWDPDQRYLDPDAIRDTDSIVHLAGAGVADKRWTEERKKEIRDSRTRSSAWLVESLKQVPNRVQSVVSASAIGWYGRDKTGGKPRAFEETDPPDEGFLGQTCQQWEQSIQAVAGLGKRLVILRTGIVLSAEGGILAELRKSLRYGMASVLGSGAQIISWIHIEDLCRIYLEAIRNDHWQGVYNAVAPGPVSNKELSLALARTAKGTFYMPFYVPSLALKGLFGEMSVEILKSTTVSSKKISATGFQFLFPSVEAAMQQLTKAKA
jgi:uncharacterized protein